MAAPWWDEDWPCGKMYKRIEDHKKHLEDHKGKQHEQVGEYKTVHHSNGKIKDNNHATDSKSVEKQREKFYECGYERGYEHGFGRGYEHGHGNSSGIKYSDHVHDKSSYNGHEISSDSECGNDDGGGHSGDHIGSHSEYGYDDGSEHDFECDHDGWDDSD